MYDQESSRSVQQQIETRRTSIQKGRADNALEERLFEQAAVGIIHVGSDGRLQRANRRFCAMLGYSEEELAHLSLQDLSHPDDRVEDLAHLTEIAGDSNETYECEKRYRRKDGSHVWVSLAVTPVRDNNNTINYLSITVQDISK